MILRASPGTCGAPAPGAQVRQCHAIILGQSLPRVHWSGDYIGRRNAVDYEGAGFNERQSAADGWASLDELFSPGETGKRRSKALQERGNAELSVQLPWCRTGTVLYDVIRDRA
jgi:hypothetical protein